MWRLYRRFSHLEMIGRTVSHYRILSQLGAGGMGVVYRAEDTRLGREVAMKFVSDDFVHDEQAVQRLRSEARAASALNHPNICTIFDVGEDEGRPFIVMELMKGQTLRDRLHNGLLRVHQLVDIGIQIADALQATHTDGIIHRDVKPGNIFLTERGHVKVLDFGLAKLTPRFIGANPSDVTVDRTVAGTTLGTVSYMSPEQAAGEELDGRTDLFSLGVVLYECATGQHPFPGKTSALVLSAILSKAPTAPVSLNPQLPIRLQEIINNCLEKDRELRYQSAADLGADLKRLRREIESGHSRTVQIVTDTAATTAVTPVAREASTAVASAPALSQSTPPAPSRIGRMAAVAAVALLLVVGGWMLRSQLNSAPPAESTSAGSLGDSEIESRLALARTSLEGRNYRAAVDYATEVLVANPGHSEAAAIRGQAEDMLAQFDVTLALAREHLVAGNVPEAASAIEAAREIDPDSPGIAELSAQLANMEREREGASRAQNTPPPAASAGRPQAQTPQRASAPATRPAPPASSAGTGASGNPDPSTASPNPTSTPPDASPSGQTPPASAAKPEAQTTAPQASASAPASAPPSVVQPVAPATAAAPAASRALDPAPSVAPPPSPPPAEPDEAVIRRVVAAYGRAIENKDVALFRSVKPNLSAAEERRLQEGFRAVTSQRVELTVASVAQKGDNASVVVDRRDVIQAGGRQSTVDSQQTLTLARAAGGWIITEIR